MNITAIQNYYSGFKISKPVSNNAFSYGRRKNKSIWVPPLIRGAVSDLAVGSKIVFSEMEEDIEKNKTGLKQFIYYPCQGKDIFIFDNHNQAFFFWLAGYMQGKIKPGLPLVHIDQHTDMREPTSYPDFSLSEEISLKQVFDYTNNVLNVGNFIRPALQLGLFSEVQIIDSTAGFERDIPRDFILDIDMDVFSTDMAYIKDVTKILKIKRYLKKAGFITIATSPYFMNQSEAITFIRELFK